MIDRCCVAFRISATLSCPMKLQKYPLDTQSCPMMFESCKFTTYYCITLHYYVTMHSMCQCIIFMILRHITSHYISSHRIPSPRISSHCIALHRIPSRRIASHPIIASHYIASHRIPSRRIASHCIASHRIPSHRIASHCIALHRIAFRYLAITLHCIISIFSFRLCRADVLMFFF